ncbi:toxin glutamine deamidase domain-containing protein [Burkholderia multivorans]|nr:hypothetical protein [Burkholderia multivorans]
MGPHLVARQLSRILNPRCLQAEKGTRAVVYGTDGVTGHVWNAVVQNGKVNYIDGQIGGGGAVNFQNFTHFQFGKLP